MSPRKLKHLSDCELAKALVVAAKKNDLSDVTNWLVQGASPNDIVEIDGEEHSAADFAIEHENVEMIHLMRASGAHETREMMVVLQRLDTRSWTEIMQYRSYITESAERSGDRDLW